MHEALSIALLEQITRFYLRENRFEGIPLVSLADRQQTDLDAVKHTLRTLVRSQLVHIEFGDRHPDPHVRALHDAPIWHQLDRLEQSDIEAACVFPAQRHLERVVNVRFFTGQPYTLRLALGAPRLKVETFHPSVLSFYEESAPLGEPGIVLRPATPPRRRMPVYGLAYDATFHRAVAACVGELADLPPIEQQLWMAKSIQGSFRIHPDYERAIYGHGFNRRLPIYRALQEEILTINRCCAYLRRPALFPQTLVDGLFLNEIGMLARPSVASASRFLSRLQILTIQNLNTAFFEEDDVETRSIVGPYEREVILPTTTLERFDNWLMRYWEAEESTFKPYLKALRIARRRIRRIQHAYLSEGWEETMGELQRSVMRTAYTCFRQARKVLERRIGHDLYMHPAARAEQIWSL
ncbi:MAG: hypothetical protein R2834_18745 [Rhodothermales bacterium]